MNLTLRIAWLSFAGLTVLGANACKVSECTETAADGGTTKKENCLQLEPTIEYRDARHRGGGQAWTSGQRISIHNGNGPLKVAVGNPGDERVIVDGIPFTRETDNAAGAQKAKDRLGAMADPAISGGDSIDVVAPGSGFDGYDLTVWIPSDFDAALAIVNENGTTLLYGADGTASTTVQSHEIDASNLRRSINLHAKVGDIKARGPLGGPDNIIRTDLGDIFTFLGAANLKITAQSSSGMVSFPTDWMQNVAADKMTGSATLGDGTGSLDVSTGGGNITFYAQ